MTHFDRGPRNRRARAALAASLIVLVGACGGDDDSSSDDDGGGGDDVTTLAPTSQHFDSDLAPVCRGTGADWATAYDPAAPGAHKVVVFEGESEADMSSVSTGNTDWDVLYDTASDAYAAVELVACAVRTSTELAQTCTGYTDDDGTDSGKSVDYHSATYEVTLRAATTAEVIDQTTVEATADVCPMLVFFDEGETTKTEYAHVDVNEFLLPHAST